MPILFAVVARGPTVLAKYAGCAGNFMEVVEQVLPPENNKLTYTHANYLFHYVTDNRLVYLCITDDDFERSRAFLFLGEIQRRFFSHYGVQAQTALAYSMNSDFSKVLAAQMAYFNSEPSRARFEVETEDVSKVNKVQGQVDELKSIMVKNIDNLASRGERLELLVDKTEDLSINSVSFKKTSRNLARSMWWKNIKLTVAIVLVLILVIYIIVSISCGGLAWQKCVK